MADISVRCPGCSTTFDLDPEKLTEENPRASCSVCSAVIELPHVNADRRQADPFGFPEEDSVQDRDKAAPQIGPRRRPNNPYLEGK